MPLEGEGSESWERSEGGKGKKGSELGCLCLPLRSPPPCICYLLLAPPPLPASGRFGYWGREE